MLQAQYEAEILTPANAEKERRSLESKTQSTELKGRVEAELEQLGLTINTLQQGGKAAFDVYQIEHLDQLLDPFAETLSLFPAENVTVISGAGKSHAPLSAIHPHPIEEGKAQLLRDAMGLVDEPDSEIDPEPPQTSSRPIRHRPFGKDD